MKKLSMLFAILGALVAISCAQTESAPEEPIYILKGQIKTVDGTPIAKARVTANGIEAETLTDTEGRYEVRSPYPWGNEVLITVQAEGYEPFANKFHIDDTTKEIIVEHVQPIGTPSVVKILNPTDGAHIVFNPDCNEKINIEGVVSLQPRPSFMLDAVFVIDSSGSTSRTTEEGNQIYALELNSARKMVQLLRPYLYRVGLVKFAASANPVLALTNNKARFLGALNQLANEGPEPLGESGSGTNYEEALLTAKNMFEPYEIIDSNSGRPVPVQTLKVVLFLSDGIPTLPAGDGYYQEREDIEASLNAAYELKENSIVAYTFAVGIDTEERKLTTLPAIAAITGGSFFSIPNPETLEDTIVQTSLVGMYRVEVKNEATGEVQSVYPNPDGFFTAQLGITEGEQQITVRAFPVGEQAFGSASIAVVGVALTDPPTEPVDLAELPVSERGLKTPYGKPINDQELIDLFYGRYALYPDAREALGAQLFYVPGDPNSEVELQGEFVFKQACYKSDVGFVVVNPSEGVESVNIASLDSSNVLFNSGDFGNSCNATLVDEGAVRFSFSVPGGSYVAFFIVPNATLEDAQSGDVPALFTIPALNPGGFAQSIVYYSPEGRLGSNTTVLAFEDISLSTGRSDEDYSDVVFEVRGVIPIPFPYECEAE